MTRQQKIDRISDLCDQHSCSDKVRKIHFDQFVNHRWHPHPSSDFAAWWPTHPDAKESIDVKRAWNCERYRQEHLESKQIGAA